jgi:hypothetical protein
MDAADNAVIDDALAVVGDAKRRAPRDFLVAPRRSERSPSGSWPSA